MNRTRIVLETFGRSFLSTHLQVTTLVSMSYLDPLPTSSKEANLYITDAFDVASESMLE